MRSAGGNCRERLASKSSATFGHRPLIDSRPCRKAKANNLRVDEHMTTFRVIQRLGRQTRAQHDAEGSMGIECLASHRIAPAPASRLQTLPRLVLFCRIWPKVAELGPNLVQFCRKWTEPVQDRHRTSVAKAGPKPVQLNRSSAKHRAEIGLVRNSWAEPKLVQRCHYKEDTGPALANLERQRSRIAKDRAETGLAPPPLDRKWPCFSSRDRSWPNFADRCTALVVTSQPH